MAERPVLVLTQQFDSTTDYVVTELNRRGVPIVRLDPGDFPAKLTFDARLDEGWSGVLRGGRRVLDLAKVRSVYYRRPLRFGSTRLCGLSLCAGGR